MTKICSPMVAGLSLILTTALASCSRYDVSLNDRLIYQPSPLFANYMIDDAALKQCLDAIISNQKLTTPEQLTVLSCPPGDITSLAGLKTFSKIRQLAIKDNRLFDIDELRHLPDVTHLHLEGNALRDVSVLNELPMLKELNVNGNSEIRCATLSTVRNNKLTAISLPVHCQAK